MKKGSWLSLTLSLVFSGLLVQNTGSLASQDQDYAQAATSAPKAVKKSNKTPARPPRLSRKCGIYSGICFMVQPAEVGAYCVCHTPAGINYGVIIP